MNEARFIEGNKKIANFMGFTYFPFNMEGVEVAGWKTDIRASNITKFNSVHDAMIVGFKRPDGEVIDVTPHIDLGKRWIYLCRHHTSLSYHKKWDWLMPVYIKIVQMFGDDNHWVNNDEEAIILFNIMYERLGDGDGVEEVWNWIVQFIDHYNKHNNDSINYAGDSNQLS
jgi:hypothetical protein